MSSVASAMSVLRVLVTLTSIPTSVPTSDLMFSSPTCTQIPYSTYSWDFNFANLELFTKFIQLKFEPLCCHTHMGNVHP